MSISRWISKPTFRHAPGYPWHLKTTDLRKQEKNMKKLTVDLNVDPFWLKICPRT